MADEVSQVVDQVVERVRARLQAFKAGTEEPCTASPAKPNGKSDEPCDDGGCNACPNHDSCATVGAVREGAARISPDRIRTSADIAPFIDHTLLKADATRDEVLKLCDEA